MKQQRNGFTRLRRSLSLEASILAMLAVFLVSMAVFSALLLSLLAPLKIELKPVLSFAGMLAATLSITAGLYVSNPSK